jgi:hypothetical protein
MSRCCRNGSDQWRLAGLFTRLTSGVWRDGKPFAQRFEAQIDDDGKTMRGLWYSPEGEGDWKPDFDLVYIRSSE